MHQRLAWTAVVFVASCCVLLRIAGNPTTLCSDDRTCPPGTCVMKPNGGYLCACRLFHTLDNGTWKPGYENCTKNFSPWPLSSIEAGADVDEPWRSLERTPDQAFNSSGFYEGFHPYYARLQEPSAQGGWCAPTDAFTYWMQVDLGNVSLVTMIATQGRSSTNIPFCVGSYRLQESVDGFRFRNVTNFATNGTVFLANDDVATPKFNFLYPALMTRYLRITPITYQNMRCMRLEVYGRREVNECAGKWAQCDRLAACTDTLSSYTCTCPTGYWDKNGNGFVCEEINECRPQLPEFGHNCHKYATCTNTISSFQCTCNVGFRGDGVYCEDVNECVDIPGICIPEARCNNTIGSYKCLCMQGYTGDGQTCQDINECRTPESCDAQARCTNTIGSYTCTCRAGYTGNGRTCRDIDECKEFAEPPCHVDATCINNPGSYKCSCFFGYRGNGRLCEDVNECTEGWAKCGLGERCQNTYGRFNCICPGYMPYFKPLEIAEYQLLDIVISNLRKVSKADYSNPIDYHAHNVKVILQAVERTYEYRFLSVEESYFLAKTDSSAFALEVYQIRCSDLNNITFPNLCHKEYVGTEFKTFTDKVIISLTKDEQVPYEEWAVAPKILTHDLCKYGVAPSEQLSITQIAVNSTLSTSTRLTSSVSHRSKANCTETFNTSSGWFTSPNFPSSYPPETQCSWTIIAPPLHNIYVVFSSFETECDRYCFYDYVEIFDGDSENSPSLGRFCGRYTKPVRSTGRFLTVTMHTDVRVEYSGFRAKWSFLEPRVQVACIAYNQLSQIPTKEDRTAFLNRMQVLPDMEQWVSISRLFGCMQFPECNTSRPRPIEYIFEHFLLDRNDKTCIMWDIATIGTSWTQACRVLKTNKTHTHCACKTWGVVSVMGRMRPPLDRGPPRGYELGQNCRFSLILVILCLLMTLLYLLFKDQWAGALVAVLQMKEFDSGRILQMQVVASTLVTEILFVIVTYDISPSKIACFVMAMIFYYSLQTVFTWGFIYSIFLHSQIQHVFETKIYNTYKIYLFIGYGIPLLVTVTITGLEFNSNDEHMCWLRLSGTTVWGFSGCIVSLAFSTLIILALTIHQAHCLGGGLQLIERCLRQIFITFFVLLTALFGARAFADKTFAAEYGLALCNMLQGFAIAVMYCILTREKPLVRTNQVSPYLQGQTNQNGDNTTMEQADEESANKDMSAQTCDSDSDGECMPTMEKIVQEARVRAKLVRNVALIRSPSQSTIYSNTSEKVEDHTADNESASGEKEEEIFFKFQETDDYKVK